LAHVLKALGSEHVWVVHGEGLDELTTAGTTQVAELKNGAISTFTLTPEETGLKRVGVEDLKGGDPIANAAALREVLDGAKNAYRDIACLNAAAGLIVAGLAEDIADGLNKSAESIDSGKAKAVAEKTAALSRGAT
jgi:anthranilate phosphoribosyltransferase